MTNKSRRPQSSCVSKKMLNWNTETGLFFSGWTPCSSSGFHIDIDSSKKEKIIIGCYEDLRPGPEACCLMSIPPLILFSPCICPIISSTSKAYRWSVYFDHHENLFCCKIEEKTLFRSHVVYLKNLTRIELVTRQKAHTMSEYDGSTQTISLTTQHILLHHSHGVYEFPDIPIDMKVQYFINEVQLFLCPNIPSTLSDVSYISAIPIYSADCILQDSEPLLLPSSPAVSMKE